MEDLDGTPSAIGWARAIVASVAVAIVGAALLVVVPNLVMTRWTALVHSARVAIAVVWFFIALIGLAVVLRKMQRRHLV